MKYLKFLLNSRGLSLTEMMVGVGIMGGLSLIVMNLAEQGIRTGNQINKESEVNEFQNLVVKSFEFPEYCELSLSIPTPTTFTSISGTSRREIGSIYNNSKNISDKYIFWSFDSKFASVNTKNGVTLSKAYVEKYDANLKTADLVTEFQYKLDAKQKTPITKKRRITLGITPNSTNSQVQSCYVKSTGIDLTGPKVVVEQDSTQVDPAQALPIKFVVGFDEPIDPNSFKVADVTNTGTATGVTWSLSSTDNTTWYLQATAVTNPGTLRPSLGMNVVKDRAGNNSEASTSKDNVVTYTPPPISWLKDSPYPPMPDNFGNAICNTVHVYTLKNNGAATTGTITTSLSSSTHFNIGTDNCNTKTLAGGATCTVEVKFLAASIAAGTYSVDLNASISGAPPTVFNITGTKVTTDPCISSPVPGTICSGCNSIFVGSSGSKFYLTTRGGCTDSATPTCSGGPDAVIKNYGTNGITTGYISQSDGAINTKGLAENYSDTLSAKFCENMVFGGVSDWFLPAKNELYDYLYKNMYVLDGIRITGFYGSSTEDYSKNTEYLGYQFSPLGPLMNFTKIGGVYLRCLRKFDSTDPCQALTAPSIGTNCLGGAKYLGTLTVGGVTKRYMTTPGGCTDVPNDANRGGADSFNYYTTANFTPNCLGTSDTVMKKWIQSGSSWFDIPSLLNTNSDTNSGEYNTPIIAAITLSSEGGYHPAARYCDKLVFGGYSDWFLPNYPELDVIYTNRTLIGGTASGFYHSSSEGSDVSNYVRDFSSGGIGNSGKLLSAYVRCVRRY